MEGFKRFLIISLFLFPLLFSGCAGINHVRSYNRALEKWTRSEKVYVGLETRLYVSATYKDASFRNSYVDRYASGFELDAAMRDALLQREMEEAEKFNEFFFAVYTPDDRWNDFERAESIWRLYLEDNLGSRLSPISIRRLDPGDPLLREFFPYFDLWSAAYIVRFPKYSEAGSTPIPGPETGLMRLVVAGMLGKGELTWRLK